MSQQKYLIELMDKAKASLGSDYKVAQALELNPTNLAAWRAGRRPCPPADMVLLAEIAGLEPEHWAARALVAQHEGTNKGEKLQKALRKLLVATGGVTTSFIANAALISPPDTVIWFIRCALLLSRRRPDPIGFYRPAQAGFFMPASVQSHQLSDHLPTR